MDLAKLVQKYGEDKVEKYYSIYLRAKWSAGGSTLIILRLINENLLNFTDDQIKTGLENIDLKEFFECVYWFVLLPKFFN
nr:p9 [Lettuce chlorosis virus]